MGLGLRLIGIGCRLDVETVTHRTVMRVQLAGHDADRTQLGPLTR